MRTKQECYKLIKDAIIEHGFEVRYHDKMVSPDQTPHLASRMGKNEQAHDVMFMLRMEREFGKEKGEVILKFSGCARMSGGSHTSDVLMRMARELRDGARLVKHLTELDLRYIDKDYKKPESWLKRYA